MDRIVEREIDGVLYKARFKGMGYAYSLIHLMNTEQSEYHLAQILFSEVLVSPEVGIDDFDDLDALDEVRSFLLDVAIGNYEKPVSNSRLRRQVDEEWACWRLLFSDISSLDYDTVFNRMTPIEIEKANIALDKVYKQMNSKIKKK